MSEMSALQVNYFAQVRPRFWTVSQYEQQCDSGAMGGLNSATVSLRVAKHQP